MVYRLRLTVPIRTGCSAVGEAVDECIHEDILKDLLRILDRNTVNLMIDELQETVNTQREQLVQKDELIEKLQAELAALKNKK